MNNSVRHCRNHKGFTLIELMVTLALIVILAALAAPALREYAIKSNLRNIGNEFTAGVLRARNEAISKNTCVTMCMSNTTDNALPACKTTDTDWQVGWIAFLNTSCNTTIAGPTAIEDVIFVRRSVGDQYFLNSQASTPRRKLTFNSRGYPGLTNADEFDLVYSVVNDPMTSKYAFNICLDKLGRTRTISTDSSC
ncbi:GspH/FimT family pseudopilin [Rhodoferax mekongensis]|uniref:GspH/FimT family pseudopilin n=1 Tax=Rhodoferax mekongensis TaxID=3068341 RepID=UPI003D17F947